MNEIREWLNSGKNYNAGVKLYNKYGDDPEMKDLFREFRTPFKEKKLLELLKGLIDATGIQKKAEEEKQQTLKKEAAARQGWPITMDLSLSELHKIWKPLYDEFRSLVSRLYDTALAGKADPYRQIEAGNMAHRILDLRDEIADIYSRRDHYLDHGKFPGEKQSFKPITGGPEKIAERRLTVRRYLTRLKNELAKPGKPNIRMKQEQQWKQYSEEMRWINQQLKRPEDEGIPTRNSEAIRSEGTD